MLEINISLLLKFKTHVILKIIYYVIIKVFNRKKKYNIYPNRFCILEREKCVSS